MSTTVTLFEYSYNEGLVGSVVNADATATTYSLGCPAGQGTTCFGYGKGVPTITVVGGPSTAAQTIMADDLTGIVTCKLTATASPYGGACARTDRSGDLTFSTTFNPASQTLFATFIPIVVTGGLEKLQAGQTGGSAAPTGGNAAPRPLSASLRGCLVGVSVAVLLCL